MEINKTSEDKKNIGGIKINSWTLSPNFSSFSGVANTTTNKYRKKLNFKERKKEENFYIRINLFTVLHCRVKNESNIFIFF